MFYQDRLESHNCSDSELLSALREPYEILEIPVPIRGKATR